mgnify:CR=1 FL=1
MTITKAENKIKQAGGSTVVFWEWMNGQTLGLDATGQTDVYEYDVDRFIRTLTFKRPL